MASNLNLNIRIGANLKEFSTKMQNLERDLNKISRKFKQTGKRLSTQLTLPIGLAGAASIKLASDFEESMNKVQVAFGGASGEVENFAKTTLKSFGIAEGTALDMAATFGDMATSMGLSQSQAASMSTKMVGLAGDLASFKNIRIDVANTALASIFTGETESLKKLGIVMTEANLQQFAMEQGITKSIKSMSQAEKVQLRYQYVTAKTANAQGDFARTGGGAANQMRVFQESLKELGQQFGQIVLPLFTRGVKALNAMIERFRGMSDTGKQVVVVVAGITAAIGPLIYTLGILGKMLSTSIGAFTKTNLKILAITAAIAALVAGFLYLRDNWEAVTERISNLTGKMKNFMIDALQSILRGMSKTIGSLFELVGQDNPFTPLIDGLDKYKSEISTTEHQFKSFAESMRNQANMAAEALGFVKKQQESVNKEITNNPINGGASGGSGSGGGGGYSSQYGSGGAITLTPKSLNNVSSAIDRVIPKAKNLQTTLSDTGEEAKSTFSKIVESVGGFNQIMSSLISGIGEFAGKSKQLALFEIATNTAIAIARGIAQAMTVGFPANLGAIAATISAVFSGMSQAKGALSGATAFASGGIVSGPTLGLVGEYAGAKRNPEVIAPLDRLQSMLKSGGMGDINVYNSFDERGITTFIDRGNKRNNRTR